MQTPEVLSLAPPTAADITQTAALKRAIKALGLIETPVQTQRREAVLTELRKMTRDFIRSTAVAKGMSETLAAGLGGKVMTFGSYRLGVHHPSSVSGISNLLLFTTKYYHSVIFIN